MYFRMIGFLAIRVFRRFSALKRFKISRHYRPDGHGQNQASM